MSRQTLDGFFKQLSNASPSKKETFPDAREGPQGAPSFKEDSKKFTQLCFDSKQAVMTCSLCQMTYNSTIKKDKQLHTKFHEDFLKNVS